MSTLFISTNASSLRHSLITDHFQIQALVAKLAPNSYHLLVSKELIEKGGNLPRGRVFMRSTR